MRSFLAIVALELRALVRSGFFALLVVASACWLFVVPRILHGDGTADGMRELLIRFSLGGIFVLLAIALMASATGALARERATKRLQLTLVRPVAAFAVALGKMVALTLVGAVVLALACVVLAVREDLSRPCRHVLAPILPSPQEEAEVMYEEYMKSPDTPSAVKAAPRATVVRLLANRVVDRFETIGTNAMARWRFADAPDADSVSVRMRFTNPYEMRQWVRGEFSFGSFRGAVSNLTQAIIEVPLVRVADTPVDAGTLVFANRGASAVMLRPRRDLHLLLPADAFGRNLWRAYGEMIAVLALLVAVGVFLSAGLSRPVALFTALVLLLVSEISPSVAEQYPDELEKDRLDRMGLAVVRAVAEVTHPISAARPLESLAQDECIESDVLVRHLLSDLLVLPVLLALLSAALLPRKAL